LQVPALVAQVILDEEAQSDRVVCTDDASCREPVFRDLVNDGSKNVVFNLPPEQ